MASVMNRKGQGLIEYAMILVLMGLLAVTAIKNLGTQTKDAFDFAGTTMTKELQNAKSAK